MDFLKKAKAQLKELEGDLNQATAALGFGEKKEGVTSPAPQQAAQDPMAAAAPSSYGSTPASTSMNTPSTSVAPSAVNDAPKTKLPLAIRKKVRDDYELKLPELEAKLASVLGPEWKTSIDPGYVYSFAEDRYAKENPGQMLTKYVEEAIKGIEAYLSTYGANGMSELNGLCSAHILTIQPATNPKISHCGSEISDGQLRIVFKKGQLGTNIRDSMSELATTINGAGVAANGGSGGGAALDFNAKNGIRNDYEPEIGAVEARIMSALATPVTTLHPNFESNFAKIAAYTATGKQNTMFPREWQKHLGRSTLSYFNAFAAQLEGLGFPNDDMLQEGFKDVVEKNEVSLRVVDKLVKGTYNECVFEGGVCYIQTTPEYWTTNIRDTGARIVELL